MAENHGGGGNGGGGESASNRNNSQHNNSSGISHQIIISGSTANSSSAGGGGGAGNKVKHNKAHHHHHHHNSNDEKLNRSVIITTSSSHPQSAGQMVGGGRGKPPKTSSFQITSVTVGTRPSTDNGEDSADDLDESHTDENSRVTDQENETPSFSEDTFSKEDVFFSTNAIGTAPVIPTSSQYGLAIVTPELNGQAIGQNLVGDVHVSVTEGGININVSGNSIKQDDLKDMQHRNERFKVVKIESTEPFKRGRWVCMDYLDHTTLQSNEATLVNGEGGGENEQQMEGKENCPQQGQTAPAEFYHNHNSAHQQSVSPGQTMGQQEMPVIPQSLPPQQLQQILQQSNISVGQQTNGTSTTDYPGSNQQSPQVEMPASQIQTHHQGQSQPTQFYSQQSQQPPQNQSQQALINPQQPLPSSNIHTQGVTLPADFHNLPENSQIIDQQSLLVKNSMILNQSSPSSQSSQATAEQLSLLLQQQQQQNIELGSQSSSQQGGGGGGAVTVDGSNPSSTSTLIPPASSSTGAVSTTGPPSSLPPPENTAPSTGAPTTTSNSSSDNPNTSNSNPSTTNNTNNSSATTNNTNHSSSSSNNTNNQKSSQTSGAAAVNSSPNRGARSNVNQITATTVPHSSTNIVVALSQAIEQNQRIQHHHHHHQHHQDVVMDEAGGTDNTLAATAAGNQQQLNDDNQSNDDNDESASGTSAVAIDNKIEQAMDLVKSHLMFAVREEVEVLKEKIAELMDRINQLEVENSILRANASQETLSQLSSTKIPNPNPANGTAA